jgi:N-succinyldiaminopimelate aminotransferase
MIEFPPSDQSVFAMMSELAVRHSAINLGQGTPETPTPEPVISAATEAMHKGLNQYSASPGVLELREEVASTGQLSGMYDPATEITIFAGCTEALSATVLALASSGDEVLAFEPYYDYYPVFAAMAGARFVSVPLRDHGAHFCFDADALQRRLTQRSRILLLNTPHNPTGHVFSESELSQIAEIATEANLIVICDEVYESYTYSVPHRSIAALPGMRERTIVASSASKTFHATGWRVGWTRADKPLSERVRACHAFTTYCAPTPLQYGIAAGLRLLRETSYLDDLRSNFCHRRDYLVEALREAGFDPMVPEGTFFVLAHRGRWQAGDALEFCRELTISGGVTALPVLSFFTDRRVAQPYVRFAFCRCDDVLEAAGNRLLNFARSRLSVEREQKASIPV